SNRAPRIDLAGALENSRRTPRKTTLIVDGAARNRCRRHHKHFRPRVLACRRAPRRQGRRCKRRRAAEAPRRSIQLEQLGHQAADMVPLVFTVIVCTVALYGLLIGRMAKRLDLADPSPQGVVFAGVSPLIVELAEILSELKIPVLVVDRNYDSLSQARMSGVTTENVNILSEYASEEMGLSGIRYLVACTYDGDTNATATRQFKPI